MKTAIEVGNDLIAARPVRGLTKPEAEVLIGLSAIEVSGKALLEVLVATKQELPTLYKIMAFRLDFHKVPYDPAAVFWLASCADRPGTAILYCAALAALADKNGGNAATLGDATQAFPSGVPDDSALQKVWLSQKRPGYMPDNWLDYPEAWPTHTA